MPAYRNMDPVKLAKLGSALEETEHAAGTNVITQGEKGDRFYILESGNVDILLDPLEPEEGGDEPVEDAPTEPVFRPDFFSEFSILHFLLFPLLVFHLFPLFKVVIMAQVLVRDHARDGCGSLSG